MRASRLLSVLLLIQNRGLMTAEALAAELEVSVRTIYRDIEALGAAGVPLYGDAGPGGGYQLLAGFRTRLTGLTYEEAQALFLSGMPGPAAELGLGTVVASTAAKLRAALPVELSQRADAIQARFHFDAPGWYQDGDASPHLAAVAGAVWDQSRIQVRYRRWKEPTDVTRTLEPYGIVLKAGRWYLVAVDVERPEPRTYRINQILAMTALDEHFERIVKFSLADYWRSHLVEFRAGLLKGEAEIKISAAGRDRMAEIMPGYVVDAVAMTAGPPDADGWVTAMMPIESLTNAQMELLKLGGEVEVVAPAELRERLAAAAAAMTARYQRIHGS